MAAEPRSAIPHTLLQIHPLRPEHLHATATLHAQHLPNGLFPALGTSFLTQWHRTFIDSKHASAAVMVDPSAGGHVAGYLLLALDPAQHVRDAKTRYRRQLIHHGCVGLLRRPRVGAHFLRTRSTRYARHLLASTAPSTSQGTVEALGVVHAVVTHPSYQRQGVATRLLTWAAAEARRAGIPQLALVTDAPTPPAAAVLAPDASQGAAALYEHLGWQRVATRQRDGRTLIEFRRTTAEPQEADA